MENDSKQNVLRVAFQKFAHFIASSGADGVGHLPITGDLREYFEGCYNVRWVLCLLRVGV